MLYKLTGQTIMRGKKIIEFIDKKEYTTNFSYTSLTD